MDSLDREKYWKRRNKKEWVEKGGRSKEEHTLGDGWWGKVRIIGEA